MWCVDFKDQKIYLYPPEETPAKKLYFSSIGAPAIQLKGVSYLTLRGLTVKLNRGDGILVQDGEHDLIAGCTVCNVNGTAITLEKGSHHQILSCDLYNLGEGGVMVTGGDDQSSPRVPAGHQVINNHIYNFGEIQKVYAAAINCGYAGGEGKRVAVGNLIAHNLIHDTPHVGILFGSFDNIYEYNEIFRFALVSNDIGGFYTYQLFKFMGNDTIRYNLIHSTVDGDGIYFDWDHHDVHVYGNIVALKINTNTPKACGLLYKVGTQTNPKYASDPSNTQPLDCYNNLILNCGVGGSFWIPSNPPSRVENNVFVTCAKPYTWTALVDHKAVKGNETLVTGKNMVYSSDPGFVDAAHLNYHLKPDSLIRKDLPGFQPIPLEKIGLFVDEYRKRLPTDDEIDRFSLHTALNGFGYSVEDRKP
jgi:hypothetical protein